VDEAQRDDNNGDNRGDAEDLLRLDANAHDIESDE
jgi:hypothetical protein